MSDPIIDALRTISSRIVTLAQGDAELRAELRQLASAILEVLPAAPPEVESPQPVAKPAPPTSKRPDVEYISATEAVEALSLGKTAAADAQQTTQYVPAEYAQPTATGPDFDLALLETHCRMKAEGAHWAATRRRRLDDGVDYQYEIEPADRDLIDRARKVEGCYLWMNNSTTPEPESLDLFDEVGSCFETTADATALARTTLETVSDNPELFEDSLNLLAEAQSALRKAIERIDGPTDRDQTAIHNWLKQTAYSNQIFIQRYMRVDDPAEPTNNDDLAARISTLDDRVQRTRNLEKNRRKLLSKIRYEAKRFAEQGFDAADHLTTLMGAVDEIVGEGMPPSNSQLRELLLPIVDEIPESFEATPNVALVFREIDRYLANVAPQDVAQKSVPPIEEVQKVAELLAGKAVFLVGGDRRGPAHARLMNAFGLSELIWFDTKEHESADKFEPHVARDDVAVVVLAIRWASHSYSEVLRDFCDRFGKPLVRLKAGYSPNQVAVQIWEQAGERLQGL